MGEAADVVHLVLAAGKGTRMRSQQPKVLHPVCGRPMLLWVMALGRSFGVGRALVIVGTHDDPVREALASEPIEIGVQAEPLGTGHAVLQARELLKDHTGPVLIMYGDHPLFRKTSLERLLQVYRSRSADLALLVGTAPDPSGYGRIVRDADGRIERIVEEAEASPEIRAIHEVNAAVYLVGAPLLFELLPRIEANNAKREFFLTDLVELAIATGHRVETATVGDWGEAQGINDRIELAQAEAVIRERLARHWMSRGVTLVDPERTYLEWDVEIGPDSVIEPGCRLRSGTRLGRGCRVEPGVVIDACTVGDDVWIKPNCWLEGSTVEDRCIIGPSAHLRPDTRLEQDVRIGNFVEVKNSTLGAGTKADHLSYIGDADIGAGVTIGCGAITVNYDGVRKSRTVIGDGAFVGCNANLIAPIRLEAGAYVAAGSTLTQDVPAEALAVGRARQRNIAGWTRRHFRERDKGE